MASPASVWVLADDRPGNTNQALGVAERLGVPFERKDIVYNNGAKFPNLLRGATLFGVDKEKSSRLDMPWPSLVVAAGRRLAPVARFIKKRSGGKTFLVQLMWPGAPAGDFDIIAVPEHDGRAASDNVLLTVGAPHRITPNLAHNEAENWMPRLGNLRPPYLVLLVGGGSRHGEITASDALSLARQVSTMAAQEGGSVLVSTSRRTPPAVTAALREGLTAPHFLYTYEPSTPNPYLAFLGLADALVVTGDSMSMCSEAAATGNPVFIYSGPHVAGDKHHRLHRQLYQLGAARPFSGLWEKWEYTPLDATQVIVKAIRQNWKR